MIVKTKFRAAPHALPASISEPTAPSFGASRPGTCSPVSTVAAADATGVAPVGVIGFCMGGQAVLELARAGEDLVLVASFHGLLDTARRADAAIKPRLLVCHGDRDPMVPRAQVVAFWEEMDAVGAQWHFHAYSGVKHGFTDPASDSRGLPAIGYDASADRQSWGALTGLLDEIFG